MTHLLVLLVLLTAQARDIYFGKGRESIPVPFGVETLFRFPADVKTVTDAGRFEIRPASTEDSDYSVLLVKPRMSEGASDVTFLLADGSTVRTQLLITRVQSGRRDSVYDFRPASGLKNADPLAGSPGKDSLVISELDLMRGMIRGERVTGFEMDTHDLEVPLGNPTVRARLVKRYLGKDLSGYVYEIMNEKAGQSIVVELAGLSIGNPNLAVLAQVDRSRLEGKDDDLRRTLLRVVARPGASSRKMILPVAIEERKK